MKKKVIKGWISSLYNKSNLFHTHGDGEMDAVFSLWKTKGKKIDWGEDWPPKKVKITIEMED